MIKKAGQKVPNPFGLELFVADDIHGYRPVTKRCDICRNFYEIVEGGGWHGSILQHLFFEHNAHQREPLSPRSEMTSHIHVTCPDCGRALEDYGWSGWGVDLRCRRCGYTWLLERRETFDPKELARREAKAKIYRDRSKRRR